MTHDVSPATVHPSTCITCQQQRELPIILRTSATVEPLSIDIPSAPYRTVFLDAPLKILPARQPICLAAPCPTVAVFSRYDGARKKLRVFVAIADIQQHGLESTIPDHRDCATRDSPFWIRAHGTQPAVMPPYVTETVHGRDRDENGHSRAS